MYPSILAAIDGIEYIVYHEFEIAFEPGDIIGSGMEDFFYAGIGKDLPKSFNIADRKGVDDIVLFLGRYLYEANSVKIGVKTV